MTTNINLRYNQLKNDRGYNVLSISHVILLASSTWISCSGIGAHDSLVHLHITLIFSSINLLGYISHHIRPTLYASYILTSKLGSNLQNTNTSSGSRCLNKVSGYSVTSWAKTQESAHLRSDLAVGCPGKLNLSDREGGSIPVAQWRAW